MILPKPLQAALQVGLLSQGLLPDLGVTFKRFPMF
jgi:hypothetical protein